MNTSIRIGYFVSEYPSRSHTFIRREIEALVKLGFVVFRASIRKPNKEAFVLDSLDEQEHDLTRALMPLRISEILIACLYFLFNTPIVSIEAFTFSFKTRPIGFGGFFKCIAYFFEANVAAFRFRNDHIEFLHVHFGNSGAHIGSIIARLLNIKWGLSLHGLSDFSFPTSPMLRWQISDASFTRCISYFGRAQAMLYSNPMFWDRIFVAYCGIPTRLHQPSGLVDRSTKVAAPVFRILTIGRLAPEKAQVFLIKACARLKHSGFNISCKIIGEGPSWSFLQKKIDELNVSEVCKLAGPVPESQIISNLQLADVFVSTSLMEGIPQVILEAMQASIPVIAPCIAGIPEAITHELDGLLFSPSNEEDLYQCLRNIIVSSTLASTLVSNASQTVQQKFDISATIRPLAEAIATLVGAQRVGVQK